MKKKRAVTMRTEDAIAYFRRVVLLAEALDINRKAVYQWGEFVPETSALRLEKLTAGKLKAYE